MFCHKCGKEMKDGAVACEACGAAAGQAAPASVPPASQAHGVEKKPFDHFNEAVTQKYAQFDGRSTRAEYWYFVLFSVLIQMGLGIVEGAMGGVSHSRNNVLSGLYNLAVLVPTVAAGIRRMHDTDRSGWWIIVPIVNLVFSVQDGTAGVNKYGADPKGRAAAPKAA